MTTSHDPLVPPGEQAFGGSRAQRALQRVLAALWVGVVPALLALLVLRYLVPPTGVGFAGLVSRVGRGAPVLTGVALFLAFSALLRYWRFTCPGGRFASTLPAHLVPHERDPDELARWASRATLHESLSSRAVRRHMERTLAPEARAEVEGRLSDLRAGIEAGDAARAAAAADRLTALASAALAARSRRETLSTIGVAAAAAMAALAVRALVAKPYDILSASMLPTLEPNDIILGSVLPYAVGSRPLPTRAEVIAFASSAAPLPTGAAVADVLVKRVIGLPGDRISMRGSQPVINGWPVPSCDAGEYVFLQPLAAGGSVHGRLRVEFLDNRAYLTVHSMGAAFEGTYEVKPGEVFVLGDNRGNSLDSRAWNGGHGAGLPLDGIRASARWFLVGSHRGGEPDFGRFGRSVDGLEARLKAEGLDGQTLQDGIAKCLNNRPTDTHPPSPLDRAAARASALP